MKKLLISLGLLLIPALAIQAQEKDQEKVQVYYFHNTARCATCKAVEAVTKEVVQSMDQESIDFVSINQEKEQDHPAVKKYKIHGQKLLLVQGEDIIDMTTDAFLNARTKPDKYKKILQKNFRELQK